MAYRVSAECPHCVKETNFWIQENSRGMCPCSARNTWTLLELGLTNLTYHGKTLDACEWVVKNFADNDMYKDNATVQAWVKQSQGIING